MSDVRERERPTTGRRAAHSVTGRKKSPLGWLPWAALLLLLLLGVVAFLIIRNATDSGDEPGVDVNDDPSGAVQDETSDDAATGGAAETVPVASAAPGTGNVSPSTSPGAASAGDTDTTSPIAGGTPTTSPDAGAGAPAAATATLTVGSQAVLPLPAGGLAALADQPATGTAVTVESVVADEGFWVGSSSTDRVFVFLTPEARASEGESPFQVEAGQRINLQGTLIPLPSAPDALGVDPAEGADQLAEQGHLIEATSVALS